jgi:hypothetical protein
MDVRLATCIVISEVDNGPIFAEPIFQRKYRQSAPDFPHHVVAFYRKDENCFVPASYVHFRAFGDIMLVGGGATDGRAFAHMSAEHKHLIGEAGGLLLQTLRFGFTKFAGHCDAFFGYCGDPRAYEVDLQAGFVPTAHDKLLAHWHRPLDDLRRRCLVAKAHAIGPF